MSIVQLLFLGYAQILRRHWQGSNTELFSGVFPPKKLHASVLRIFSSIILRVLILIILVTKERSSYTQFSIKYKCHYFFLRLWAGQFRFSPWICPLSKKVRQHYCKV